MSSEDERGPKTWVVQPGETLTLSADEVQPNDSYSCPGKGAVGYTPEPGEGVANSLGIQVATDLEGTVKWPANRDRPGTSDLTSGPPAGRSKRERPPADTDTTPVYSREVSRLAPTSSVTWTVTRSGASCWETPSDLERTTGFEPATPTLAR